MVKITSLSLNIPHEYETISGDQCTMIVKKEYKEELLAMGLTHPLENIRRDGNNLNYYQGRNVLFSLDFPGKQNQRMVIKHCTRGGLIKFVLKDTFMGHPRPYQELLLSNYAQKNDVNTSEIVAIKLYQIWKFFYRSDIFYLEVQNSITLFDYLIEWHEKDAKKLSQKTDTIKMVARLICRMHKAGIFHNDLNMKNILIQKDDSMSAFVIDLDRAVKVKKLSLRLRAKNLLRLHRSVIKLNLCGEIVTKTDVLRFFREYIGSDAIEFAPFSRYLKRYRWSLIMRRFWWIVINIVNKCRNT